MNFVPLDRRRFVALSLAGGGLLAGFSHASMEAREHDALVRLARWFRSELSTGQMKKARERYAVVSGEAEQDLDAAMAVDFRTDAVVHLEGLMLSFTEVGMILALARK